MSGMDQGLLFGEPHVQPLADGAVLLRGFVGDEAALAEAIRQVLAAAPWRHMVTRGGYRMSVAMTNCGRVGWVSDRRGYRYDEIDPSTGQPWPALPSAFAELGREAAAQAGFAFEPDACLINGYTPGTQLALHQDRNERDLSAPIVSVSLGLPAVFLFGGKVRTQRPQRIALQHRDVVVWGGPSRLAFHGVAPLKPGEHAFWGPYRINLTLRQAL